MHARKCVRMQGACSAIFIKLSTVLLRQCVVPTEPSRIHSPPFPNAGVIALVSSVMVLYYCYNLACIPSQPHKGKAASTGAGGAQEGGERAHAKSSSVRRRHA